MYLNFLQLLDNLVMHTSTKFCVIWICTLGYIDISLKGTESAKKNDNNWIHQESLWLKGPQVGNMFISVWGT